MIVHLKSPAFLIWLGLAVLLTWLSRETILNGSGWDPDDQLRFVQLRDFLNGQSWFDTTQYRLNAPFGGPVHWSRLIELPLAAIVLLLKPLLGQANAEIAAGVIVPLSCLGAIAFMIGQIAARLGGRLAGIVAVMMTMVSPAISMQLRPMRIDHHGWQLFCATLAFWSLFWPSPRRAGVAMGLALAVWLHISLEGAPPAVIFFALLGWRWAIGGESGQRLGWTVSAFTGGSLLLYFGTQAAGLAAPQYCDTVSPVHVWAILGAASIMVPSAFLLPANRAFRIGAAGIAVLLAGGALFALAPQCAAGAFSTMDPVVRDYWYIRVNEGMPVWHQKPSIVMSVFGVPVAGLVALAFLYRGRLREWRAELAVLLLYGLVLATLVFRTISVATLVAVPVLAVGIAALFERYRSEAMPTRRVLYVALMVLMLMPGAFASQLASLLSPDATEAAKTPEVKNPCESFQSIATLAMLPDANIVAPFDIGPAILMTTPHHVLASSHHRNQSGMRDHIDIYRLPPEQSRAIIARRKITHIVACPDEPEMKGYVKRDSTGLWGQLAIGKMPDWLEPVPSTEQGMLIWRVKR